MTEPLLSVRNLRLDIPTGSGTLHAVRGIDFDLNRGETLCIVGESGSGKTTLISIMCGILWPTQGEVKVFGTDIYELSDSDLVEFRLQNIGFIFQQFNLVSRLSVPFHRFLIISFYSNAISIRPT